eukprot:6330287-Amphidinium_carterae.1
MARGRNHVCMPDTRAGLAEKQTTESEYWKVRNKAILHSVTAAAGLYVSALHHVDDANVLSHHHECTTEAPFPCARPQDCLRSLVASTANPRSNAPSTKARGLVEDGLTSPTGLRATTPHREGCRAWQP